jgi:glycyl-tRNA synthetase beta chain
VALAVEQFYFPTASKSPIPATSEAAIVSISGKLDSLAGCFAAGMIPTGSADPYALRRQSLGLVRIIIEKQLPLDLLAALRYALSLQPVTAAQPENRSAQIADFILARAQSLWEEMGFAIDEIRAVQAGAMEDLTLAFRRLAALHALRREPAFASLAAAFKRASNILRQSEGTRVAPTERAQLLDPAEISLYDALVKAEGSSNDRIVRGDFEGGLKCLAAVKPELDHFFEHVMVMVDDEALRNQRLALLSKLVRAVHRIGDLSEIQESAAELAA